LKGLGQTGVLFQGEHFLTNSFDLTASGKVFQQQFVTVQWKYTNSGNKELHLVVSSDVVEGIASLEDGKMSLSRDHKNK
jgi:hypothetical protein